MSSLTLTNPTVANTYSRARRAAAGLPTRRGETSSARPNIQNNDSSWSLLTNPLQAAKSALGNIVTPGILLNIPFIKNYTLPYIMHWVFRAPSAKSFDPQIFRDKGYKVTEIKPNDRIKTTKFSILPEKLSSEPLMIIHGASTSARSLGGCTQAALDEGHPVIIGDFEGFGSDKGRFSLRLIQEEIRGLLDYTHNNFKKPFSILAHSFGAHNSVKALKDFLRENPDAEIKDLILISAWDNLYTVAKDLWKFDQNSGRRKIEQILHEIQDPNTKRALNSISKAQLELIKNLADTKTDVKNLAQFKSQIENTSIFYGTEDKYVPQVRSKALAQEFGEKGFRGRRFPLEGAGHFNVTSEGTTKLAKDILKLVKTSFRNTNNHKVFPLLA